MVLSRGVSQGRFVVPETVATHFHLREGDVVADFGAGSGHFISVLSRLVGHEGRVYACEIQRNLVEAMGELARAQHLSNVDVLWCDVESTAGTKLQDAVLDAGILVNTLFQLEDKNAALREIFRTLRSGGKLFVIDWTESFAGMGPHTDQVVDEVAAKALVETHGFVYERAFDAGDHHYGLTFRKP